MVNKFLNTHWLYLISFLVAASGFPAGAASIVESVAGGERYAATVPDTLELAARAELALNGLAGTLDPENDYEIYLKGSFNVNPPIMGHETTGLPTNNPKYAESFPMMRLMTGSGLYEDVERGMMKSMLTFIGEDGLYYAVASRERSWHEGIGHNYGTKTNEDFANVYGNARMLLALMAWMQYEPDEQWREKAKAMAHGLARIAIKKDDYAYYPDSKVGEAFSYPKSGWANTEEPQIEASGAEGSMFMYYCGPIRALARWYKLTGDKEIWDVATRLVKFVTQKKFWGSPGIPEDIDSASRGYFTGHMHGHTAMLYALAEYAAVSDDPNLKNFVRDSYDFARHHGIPRIGAWQNSQPDIEVCSISDMIAVAIKLSEMGMGDYWDDVDAAARNQLVESQLTRPDFIREISESGKVQHVSGPQATEDRVLERILGIMMPMRFNGYSRPYMLNCCTGNGTQGLYYAWSKIVEFENGAAKVNLLMNRASEWVDVDSYLPYEGKVVVHNKTAKSIYIRIPGWADRSKVKVFVNGKKSDFGWVGAYAALPSVGKRQDVTVEFPVPESTIAESNGTIKLRGSTVVSVSPQVGRPGYPIYLRDHLNKHKAPTKRIQRYVSPALIKW
jgi:hypothetical protein